MSEEAPQPQQVEQPNNEVQAPAPQPEQPLQNVKIVLVGDDGVGKTGICTFYKEGKAPTGSLPVIAPNFAKKESFLDKKVALVLWDSACNPEYDEIRPRAYPSTHIFLLCFALNDKKSLENAASVWSKEIADYTKDAKVILVGTKKDITLLTDKSIEPFRRLIDPYLYIECSSVSGENIQHIFSIIAQMTIDPDSVKKEVFAEPEEAKPASTESKETKLEKKEKTAAPKSTTCLLI